MGYPGGKAAPGIYHKIISLMPPHQIYIEPFYGGGAIMRHKRPAQINIGIDRDRAAIEKAWTPAESRDVHGDVPIAETSERRRESRAPSVSAESAELHEAAAPPLSELADDPLSRTIDTRSSRWIFNEHDGIEFLKFVATWWHRLFELLGPVLIYCDPPYMRETCKSRCRYKYDLADVDHRRLLRVLLEMDRLEPEPPMLMISGYDSELYREMLEPAEHRRMGAARNWTHQTFQAMTRGGTQATEHLWFNFEPPTILHDHRYVGTNFRDRERMKRRQQTWKNILKRLKPYEREALLAAIAETAPSSEAVPQP